MDLAERDDGPWGRARPSATGAPVDRAEFPQKRCPVALYNGLYVVFGEAEVELALAIGAGESAAARGKAVYEPGKLAEMLGAKNGEAGSFAGWFGSLKCHTIMVPEGRVAFGAIGASQDVHSVALLSARRARTPTGQPPGRRRYKILILPTLQVCAGGGG